MAESKKRLLNDLITVKELASLKRPGYHACGRGLYFSISSSGSRSWVYRYRINGRSREMGLGSLLDVSLAEANAKVTGLRAFVGQGIDPLEQRQVEKDAQLVEKTKRVTFSKCAEAFIAAHRVGWKNPKHAQQWENTLATYAYPVIGELPVSAVDTGLILEIIEPIWTTKTETASRLRGRIEKILDWATPRGYRSGENPARWRGHLEFSLPKPGNIAKVEHHSAMPYALVGAFLADVRKVEGVTARALEFLIFSACRTGEVIGARWEEVDLESNVWTVPANRMKAGVEHRVPITAPMREILLERQKLTPEGCEFVFIGNRPGKPLSNMALLMLMRRMERDAYTVHGFRSAFRTWAAERTKTAPDVIEQCLAHTVGSAVELAYKRTDLFQKRKSLMEAWRAFCEAVPAAGPVYRIEF